MSIAAVARVNVTVITAFCSDVANAIAAARRHTTARTGVGVDVVAVVAGLARIHPAVTANFSEALRRTAVRSISIAVIAFLVALVFGL